MPYKILRPASRIILDLGKQSSAACGFCEAQRGMHTTAFDGKVKNVSLQSHLHGQISFKSTALLARMCLPPAARSIM